MQIGDLLTLRHESETMPNRNAGDWKTTKNEDSTNIPYNSLLLHLQKDPSENGVKIRTPSFINDAAPGHSAGQLKIYPNPSSSNLFIESSEKEMSTQIFSLSGSLISNLKQESFTIGEYTNQIDITSLPAGIYIIKIGSEMSRFVKE